MNLSEVLQGLKKRSISATGKAFKGTTLINKLGIPKDRYYGWLKGSLPTDADDIKALEAILGIKNLKEIPDDLLTSENIGLIHKRLDSYKPVTELQTTDNHNIGTAYGRDQLLDMLNQLQESNAPYNEETGRVTMLKNKYDIWFKKPPLPQPELDFYDALLLSHKMPELFSNIFSRLDTIEDKIG